MSAWSRNELIGVIRRHSQSLTDDGSSCAVAGVRFADALDSARSEGFGNSGIHGAIGLPRKKNGPEPQVPLVHVWFKDRPSMWAFLSKRDEESQGVGPESVSPTPNGVHFEFDDRFDSFAIHITDAPCCMYADIDAEGCSGETIELIEMWIKKLVNAAVAFGKQKSWITHTDEANERVKNDWFSTTKHRKGKASFHVVHKGVHFSDIRAQAAFWDQFWRAKKHRTLKEEALRFAGQEAVKNANSIGIFDKCVYGSQFTPSPLRKWYMTKRVPPPGKTMQDEDPTNIVPGSILVNVPPGMYGTKSVKVKRKRAQNDEGGQDEAEDSEDEEPSPGDLSGFPSCVSRFVPKIAKALGTTPQSITLERNTSKARVTYWVKYPKTEKSLECLHDHGRVHSQNRQQVAIFVGDAETAPHWKRRCFSNNHKNQKAWKIEDVELMSLSSPPAPGNYTAFFASSAFPLAGDDVTCVSVWAFTNKPFRIGFDAYEDITNLTPIIENPYVLAPMVFPHARVISLKDASKQFFFPLKKKQA